VSKLPWSGSTVSPLDDFGLDGLIVSDDNGIALIEAAYDTDGAAVAVRVGTLTDSFDNDGTYTSIGDWSPSTVEALLDIAIGDPWEVIADGGGWSITLATAPVWHVDHSVLDGEMVGMRIWSDGAVALAKRSRSSPTGSTPCSTLRAILERRTSPTGAARCRRVPGRPSGRSARDCQPFVNGTHADEHIL
jgi:hypothetical protein